MIPRKATQKIRKTHRYLGLFIGIQFLMWTLSGLYFSWTDLDSIHGDPYKKTDVHILSSDSLISPTSLDVENGIQHISLQNIADKPYYYVNKKELYHAQTGIKKEGITAVEALAIADQQLVGRLERIGVEKIEAADPHHEYRNKPLPAYVISYNTPDSLKAYVSIQDGKFQTARHQSWRWFDFLWMTHTMDYKGRDDFNNTLLRGFSLLGLLTVLSGFLLWFVSSPTIRKFV